MSDTLRFLESADGRGAAQDFLQKRLDSYTPEQRARLDAHGGPAVVNASHGKVPTGPAYEDDNNQSSSSSSTSSAGGGDKYRGFGQDSDSGRNYSSGAWGKGNLDAEALAKKYGLDRSNEARGEGHIWGRDANGNDVYIGKSSMDLASNKDLIANHAKQANSAEVDHSGIPEDLSSAGDIKGAILTEWAGGEASSNDPVEDDEEETIEHSEEIQQAIERVRAHEDDVISGKTSDDIFGTKEDNSSVFKAGGKLDSINKKYSLNLTGNNNNSVNNTNYSDYTNALNHGKEGLGTQPTSIYGDATHQATQNFLKNKTKEVKQNYNIQPVN